VRGIGLERQIAQFVDDQQLRPSQERELFVESSIVMGLGQDRDQRRGRDKLDGVVLPDRFPAKGDSEMRFSVPGGSNNSVQPAAMEPSSCWCRGRSHRRLLAIGRSRLGLEAMAINARAGLL
jgi:hypothetical protein